MASSRPRPYDRAVSRRVRIVISLFALTAGATLICAAMAGSFSVFPGGGYNILISLHAAILGLGGAVLTISGLFLLLQRRPHAQRPSLE